MLQRSEDLVYPHAQDTNTSAFAATCSVPGDISSAYDVFFDAVFGLMNSTQTSYIVTSGLMGSDRRCFTLIPASGIRVFLGGLDGAAAAPFLLSARWPRLRARRRRVCIIPHYRYPEPTLRSR